MGKSRKPKQEERFFEQDLSQTEDKPGKVFIIHLLMEKKCKMPEQEAMTAIMNKHLGETECFSYSEKSAGFCPKKYKVHSEKKNVDLSPQLMIMGCSKIKQPVMDVFASSQLWDCEDGEEILDECGYQVMATDMLASVLNYKDRAEMLVEYVEALIEMFPSCRAVVFETSKKMITREAIMECTMPKESRFIHYAVNVRFFSIQGSDDKIVDTLGMSALFLPDLQYHFNGMHHDFVVEHAYNLLSYIYDNENPIESEDHVDGIEDGEMSPNVQWKVRYENSLVQPARMVIDVDMGEYAAGIRD